MANANALLSWAQSFTPAPEKGKDVYRATETPWHPIWGRGVFGGVLLGQSLAVAQDTVPPNFVVHSLHGSFILSAKTTVPTFYHVERLRDGKSVASRVVKAFQSEECVFTATISFFVESPSTKRGMNHQISMPTEILEQGPPSGPDQDVDPALLAEAGQTRNGSMYECVRIPQSVLKVSQSDKNYGSGSEHEGRRQTNKILRRVSILLLLIKEHTLLHSRI
ncbi:hypothetical protein V2G26_010502 [Clonostachys chloroleuca]